MARVLGSKTAYLIAAALLWPGTGRTEAPVNQADAARARQAKLVLQKHCAACHGSLDKPRGGLALFNHDLLVRDRQLVRPRASEQSELLLLIKDGTMPPGQHPKVPAAECQAVADWIDAGAPAFPPDFGEAYVLEQILEDVRHLKAADRPRSRYLSLNHLLATTAQADLEPTRQALDQALHALTAKDDTTTLLTPIEPTRSVFRVDLGELDWTAQRYATLVPSRTGPPTIEPCTWNAFDLVLLEYPYGVVPRESNAWNGLAEKFLMPAGQVRPLAYVRGDWLLHLLTQAPQAEYFRTALGKGATKPLPAYKQYDQPVNLAAVAAELSWTGPEKALGDALSGLGLAALGRGDTVSRTDWERVFDQAVRASGLGRPLIPLDALGQPEYHAGPDPVQVEFFLTLWQKRQPQDRFHEEEEVTINLRASADVRIEVIWADSTGSKNILPFKDNANRVPMRKGTEEEPHTFNPVGHGYTLKGVGQDQITVFAYPEALLKGGSLPAGTRLRAKVGGLPERIVHVFYTLREDGTVAEPLDLGRVVKTTVGLTIEPKGKPDKE